MFEVVHQSLPFPTRFNEGQIYSRKNLNILQLLVLPILSGVGATAGSPFELVEFRKQVSAPKRFQPDPYKGKIKDLFKTLRVTEKDLFIRATKASAIGSAATFGIAVFGYEGIWSLCFAEDRNWFPVKATFAGLLGSTAAVVLSNPLHLAKTTVFVPRPSGHSVGVATVQPAWKELVDAALLQGSAEKEIEKVKPQDVVIDHEAKQAFQNSDFRTALRWLRITLRGDAFLCNLGARLFENVPLLASHLALFECIKFFKGTLREKRLSVLGYIMAAGVSSAVPHAIWYPFTVLSACSSAQYVGYYNYDLNLYERAYRLIAQRGGLSGLYRGYRAAAIRYNLTIGFGLLGYECSRGILNYIRGPLILEDDDVWER